MEKKVYESYLEILREELVPALGCTEPIAIAYATATAASVLEKVIKTDDDGNKKYEGHLNLYCSGNIIKNVKSVTVPNSGGMRGIEAAAVLGMVGGQAERKLEVLEGITEAERIQTAKLLEAQFCTCYLEEGVENLYIRAELTQNGHRAVVVIENKHTNIVLIKKDDEVLLEKKGFQQKKTEKNQDKRDLLNVADILEFAKIVNIKEIEEVIGLDAEDAPLISAKEGIGIEDLLEKVVETIPAPSGDPGGKLKALIFDSKYDNYKGVIIYTRIIDGEVKKGDIIRLMNTGKKYEVTEVGICAPGPVATELLRAGEVGYICGSIKQVSDARVGDTITLDADPADEMLPGYKKAQSMVYCGIYPAEGEKYENVKDALEKLQVNDAAFNFEPETSTALGFGFRCGFLGLLHMEIIVERLEREFNLAVITTSPSVIYRVVKTDGTVEMIQNPTNLPPVHEISYIEEPMVKADIMIPKEYVGSIMELCQERRGKMLHMEYITETRVQLHYEMPLNEVIYDFFDALKSKTRGYGSLDYEFVRYER